MGVMSMRCKKWCIRVYAGVNCSYIALSPFSDLFLTGCESQPSWIGQWSPERCCLNTLQRMHQLSLRKPKTPRASASPANLSNTTFLDGGSNSHICSSRQFQRNTSRLAQHLTGAYPFLHNPHAWFPNIRIVIIDRVGRYFKILQIVPAHMIAPNKNII